MKKILVLLIVALLIMTGGYLFATRNSTVVTSPESEITFNDDGTQVVYCDENGNRYNTVAEAKAAGLSEAQYGATYCPEYTDTSVIATPLDPIVDTEYVGLTVAAAEAKAAADGAPFRVVMENGVSLPVTMDLRPGRINATVVNGMVSMYSVESDSSVVDTTVINSTTTTTTTTTDSMDKIIGMTPEEAADYASRTNTPFRVVMEEGVAKPVTMDLRPGRINAVVEASLVVSYTVE